MLLERDECRRQEKRVGLVGDVGQWSFTCISVGQPPPRPAPNQLSTTTSGQTRALMGRFESPDTLDAQSLNMSLANGSLTIQAMHSTALDYETQHSVPTG